MGNDANLNLDHGLFEEAMSLRSGMKLLRECLADAQAQVEALEAELVDWREAGKDATEFSLKWMDAEDRAEKAEAKVEALEAELAEAHTINERGAAWAVGWTDYCEGKNDAERPPAEQVGWDAAREWRAEVEAGALEEAADIVDEWSDGQRTISEWKAHDDAHAAAAAHQTEALMGRRYSGRLRARAAAIRGE